MLRKTLQISFLLCSTLLLYSNTLAQQCSVAVTPTNINVVETSPGFVDVTFTPGCPDRSTNDPNSACPPPNANSIVWFVGFYSHTAPTPNGLNLEYSVPTATDCGNGERDLIPYINGDTYPHTSGTCLDTKGSTCRSSLLAKRYPNNGESHTWEIDDICSGGGSITYNNFQLCTETCYDMYLWEMILDVPADTGPNSNDIAGNNTIPTGTGGEVYPDLAAAMSCASFGGPSINIVDESAASAKYTFCTTGDLNMIDNPILTVSNLTTCNGNGTYTNTHQMIPDILSAGNEDNAGSNTCDQISTDAETQFAGGLDGTGDGTFIEPGGTIQPGTDLINSMAITPAAGGGGNSSNGLLNLGPNVIEINCREEAVIDFNTPEGCFGTRNLSLPLCDPNITTFTDAAVYITANTMPVSPNVYNDYPTCGQTGQGAPLGTSTNTCPSDYGQGGGGNGNQNGTGYASGYPAGFTAEFGNFATDSDNDGNSDCFTNVIGNPFAGGGANPFDFPGSQVYDFGDGIQRRVATICVRYEDPCNGTKSISCVKFVSDAAALTATPSAVDVSCVGNTDGQLVIENLFGGSQDPDRDGDLSGGLPYIFTPDYGFTQTAPGTWETPATFAPGTYTIAITDPDADACGSACDITEITFVVRDRLPSTIVGDAVVCPDQCNTVEAILTANPVVDYEIVASADVNDVQGDCVDGGALPDGFETGFVVAFPDNPNTPSGSGMCSNFVIGNGVTDASVVEACFTLDAADWAEIRIVITDAGGGQEYVWCGDNLICGGVAGTGNGTGQMTFCTTQAIDPIYDGVFDGVSTVNGIGTGFVNASFFVLSVGGFTDANAICPDFTFIDFSVTVIDRCVEPEQSTICLDGVNFDDFITWTGTPMTNTANGPGLFLNGPSNETGTFCVEPGPNPAAGSYTYDVSGFHASGNTCCPASGQVVVTVIDAVAPTISGLASGDEFCSSDAAVSIDVTPAVNPTPGVISLTDVVDQNAWVDLITVYEGSASGNTLGNVIYSLGGTNASDPNELCQGVNQTGNPIPSGPIASNLAPGTYTVFIGFSASLNNEPIGGQYTIVDQCGNVILRHTDRTGSCDPVFAEVTILPQTLTVTGPGIVPDDPDNIPNSGDETYMFDPALANTADAANCNENGINISYSSECGCVTEADLAVFVYDDVQETGPLASLEANCAGDEITFPLADLQGVLSGGSGSYLVSYNAFDTNGDPIVVTNAPLADITFSSSNTTSPLMVTVSSVYNGMVPDPADPSGQTMLACDGNGCDAVLELTFEQCLTCPTNPMIQQVDDCLDSEIIGSISDPGVTVSLIDFDTGQIVSTTVSDVNGEFAFTGIGGNMGCDPEELNFIVVIVCPDTGEEIPGATSAGELSASFTIYPMSLTAIEDPNSAGGGCGDTHLDIVSADGTVCFDNVATATCNEPTCVDEDALEAVDFSTTYFNGTPCPIGVTGSVSCFCPAPPCNCPAQPDIQNGSPEVCGGGAGNEGIFFISMLSGTGNADFIITANGGVVQSGVIAAGEQFNFQITFPENNTCDPIDYPVVASFTCVEDGSDLGSANTMVTVYPNSFTTVTEGTGGCGTTSVDVVAVDGSICVDDVAVATCLEPASCTDDDTFDGDVPSASFFQGTSCSQLFTAIPATCSCAAPPCNCPTDPMLQVDLANLCGNGADNMINLSVSLNGTGGQISIVGDNGIGPVSDNVPVMLPDNLTCDPIVYTFTATVTCVDDGSDVPETTPGDLTATVTVYPNQFTAIEDANSAAGGCGDTYLDVVAADGTVCFDNVATATCATPAACTDPPTTGSSGNFSQTYFGGGNSACPMTVSGSVSCNCDPPGCNCPADPIIQNNVPELCGSGDGLFVISLLTGTGAADYTVTLDGGTIQSGTVVAGEQFTFQTPFPPNNTCDPITYVVIANFTCVDDGSFLGAANTSVTVYPNAFTAIEDPNSAVGGCGTTYLDVVAVDGSVCFDDAADVTCTSPATCVDPPTTNSQTLTGTYFPNSPCPFNVNGSINCSCDPPGCNCPTDPMLQVDLDNLCGNGSDNTINLSVSLNGTGATISIMGDNGIGMVSDNVPVALPDNLTCDPIVYTFTATVTCIDDGSNIPPVNAGDLMVTVTVYPNTFTVIEDPNSAGGGCGSTFLDVVAADGSVCFDDVAEANCTQPAVCTDPANTDNVNFSDTYFAGTACPMNLSGTVSCNCDPPGCNCPTDPMIDATTTDVCGSGSVTITGTFGNGTGGTFTITETSGAITNIQSGIPITFPANNTCDPIVYSFTATAVCDDNGQAVPPANAADMQLDITVYPNNFTTTIDGNQGCGTTTLDIIAADGSICVDDAATVTCDPPLNCGDPDDTDMATLNIDFFSGTSCEQNISNMPLSCSCAANVCNCPANPIIVADEDTFCESGTVTITASFSGGGGTGTFTITGDNGIGPVTSGIPVNLPANNSCTPITYTFTATAVCDDNGQTINPADPDDMIISVTVYPNIGSSIIESTTECMPGVISTCTSDVTIMYDLDGNGTYESTAPPAAVAGGTVVDYIVYVTGAPTSCQSQGSYFNDCTCSLDVLVTNIDDGDNGGTSPFYYNQEAVDVFNGVLPYSYEWDAVGYVRHAIVHPGDNIPYPDGEVEIQVNYGDNAYWSVTITDAVGCQVVATNDPSAGVGGMQEVIDISGHDIEGDNCLTRNSGEGSIIIYTEHGTPPYEYEWTGPSTWSSGMEFFPVGSGTYWTDDNGGIGEEFELVDLPYGWYSVTVTDSGIDDYDDPRYFDANGNPIIDDDSNTPLPEQKTEGWYWIECARPGGDRGKVAVSTPTLDVYPNPFVQTTNIEFSVPDEGITTIKLYDLEGRALLNIFNGALKQQTAYQLNFEAGPLSGGVYMIVLETATGHRIHKKLILTP